MLQAMQDACYSGERSFFEKGDLQAAIIPIEDLEVLEAFDLFVNFEVQHLNETSPEE